VVFPVAINGTIAGLEFVSRTEACRRLHERIIGGYAIEAILHERVGYGAIEQGSFIEEIMGARATHPPVTVQTTGTPQITLPVQASHTGVRWCTLFSSD